MSPREAIWKPAVAERRGRLGERLFIGLCLFAVVLPLVVLGLLLVFVTLHALPRLSFDFLSSYPSRKPKEAGILPAIVGTLWLMGLTAAFTLPVGVGAALYLEKYARKGRQPLRESAAAPLHRARWRWSPRCSSWTSPAPLSTPSPPRA